VRIDFDGVSQFAFDVLTPELAVAAGVRGNSEL